MGAMFGRVLQICFAGMLLSNMCCAAAFMKLVHFLPLSKKKREGMSLMIVQMAWRWTLLCSPWIRSSQLNDVQWTDITSGLDTQVDNPLAAGEKCARPLFLLGNHQSFFDTLITSINFPQRVLWTLRTYMASHLFKLPVLGTVCRCAGHFGVYFTSSEDGVFKVDAEKMVGVEAAVDQHLSDGGSLCFFPEGQMNKDPDKLMPFRFGGFKKALAFDAKLVSFVCHGNNVVWPRKATVGGFPGRITYSLKILTPNGSKALAAELRKKAEAEATPEERENVPADHQLLANACQKIVQEQYDQLKEDSEGSPSKKRKKGD